MTAVISPQENVVSMLSSHINLAHDDREALMALKMSRRTVFPGSYIMRDQEIAHKCGVILTGFAFRQKISINGGRQISAILFPGDFINLHELFLDNADHSIQALTIVTVAEFSTSDFRDLVMYRPAIAKFLWTEMSFEASIIREMLLNIGRRGAAARIGHLICELEIRLRQHGLAQNGYHFPLTQEQFGDATGLTAVHVNRSLRQLEKERLIARSGRSIKILDWERLSERAEFEPSYLHLDQRLATPNS